MSGSPGNPSIFPPLSAYCPCSSLDKLLSSSRCELCGTEFLRPSQRRALVCLRDDGIAAKHGIGFVSGNRHRHMRRHARANHVAHARTPEIVKQTSGNPRHAASRGPCLAHVDDGVAVMMEHERPLLPRRRRTTSSATAPSGARERASRSLECSARSLMLSPSTSLQVSERISPRRHELRKPNRTTSRR
jgi:hypothetical protein